MAPTKRVERQASLYALRKLDPYCAFRDDRERRLALISRDVRFAIVGLAIVVAITSTTGSGLGHLPWLSLFRLVAS